MEGGKEGHMKEGGKTKERVKLMTGFSLQCV